MTIDRDPFGEVGISDLETGVALFKALHMSPDRLAVDNESSAKMQIIAGFLKDEQDPTFLINKITSSNKSSSVQTIDHFVNFVNLKNRQRELTMEVSKIDEEINNHYE